MQEFKVEYHAPPFGNGPRYPSIMIVEANDSDHAEAIARDHYTRSGRGDGEHLNVLRAKEYQSPVGGRVISSSANHRGGW